ncbi:MAG: hypothetical protein MAG458_01711 [Nitrosopumilus sp.]|nr:hypothetical protein [Nitrosopumilus sp.]
MEFTDLEKTLLERMLNDNRIGGRHLGEQDVCRGFPSHEKGNVPKSLKKLIKNGLINHHPTSYGIQYSLNPKMIEKILEIIEDEKDD